MGQKKTEPLHIIDVGCGPGRLAHKIGKMGHEYFTYGLDISQSFIQFAKENKPFGHQGYFLCENFSEPPSNSFVPSAEIILMQGVMHHIHGEDRVKFLQRSFDLLKPDGILIIGDEFIKNYESEKDRIFNVAKFYLHIIDEACKGGFYELAEEEAKNLIDDCFSGTKYAGFGNNQTFSIVFQYARIINELFYEQGASCGETLESYDHIHDMFGHIKQNIEPLIDISTTNFNRGDYKVSIDVFKEEAALFGFKLAERYEIGPVKQLGGMGILVFKK